LREDEYGGDISRRTRFAAEVIQEIRASVGPEFPVVLRLSTWKQQDYSARLAANPEEWAAIVCPLAGAGVDAFHLSQRRYWEGEFGTEANLATWTETDGKADDHRRLDHARQLGGRDDAR
jgi:2,4-dienoyl-CoA reductase-like NADH-dependent reductase (Old Yellow Enzyme family)